MIARAEGEKNNSRNEDLLEFPQGEASHGGPDTEGSVGIKKYSEIIEPRGTLGLIH